MVVPGAPVSVLLDHGLTEAIIEKLMEAGITTVERLGSMTPEELEGISGIGPKMVERIQSAVVGYYGQFETEVQGAPDTANGTELAADAELVTEAPEAGAEIASDAEAGTEGAGESAGEQALADGESEGEVPGEAPSDVAPVSEKSTEDSAAG
jgi:N utilization substance protein A